MAIGFRFAIGSRYAGRVLHHNRIQYLPMCCSLLGADMQEECYLAIGFRYAGRMPPRNQIQHLQVCCSLLGADMQEECYLAICKESVISQSDPDMQGDCCLTIKYKYAGRVLARNRIQICKKSDTSQWGRSFWRGSLQRKP